MVKVKSKYIFISLLLPLSMLLSDCMATAKNASIVSQKVTEGIERIQTENEKIIFALAETQRAILDEKWDDIYPEVEKKYMKKHNISDGFQLSLQDRKKIASTAAQSREDILNLIAQREADLLKKSRANAQTVIEINDEVIQYLNSLERIGKIRSRVRRSFESMIGIDTEAIKNTVDEKLKSLLEVDDKK